MVSASENNCKIGYRLVSVEVSVRMVHDLPQTICLVLSKRKLADVALYSPACSRCCRNKRPNPDYCGNVLGSRGIGAGSSPIGCEGFVKASKVQGSSLLLSNANNFVRYSYDLQSGLCHDYPIIFLRLLKKKHTRLPCRLAAPGRPAQGLCPGPLPDTNWVDFHLQINTLIWAKQS